MGLVPVRSHKYSYTVYTMALQIRTNHRAPIVCLVGHLYYNEQMVEAVIFDMDGLACP